MSQYPNIQKHERILLRIPFLISILVFSILLLPYSAICSENTFKIQKFITAYNFNDDHIPFIASNFDIIDTDLKKVSQVQKIKEINPAFKAIFYDNALTHREKGREDWYVRDAKTGSRLVNKDWGWYLMDIGNSAYRRSLANFIKKCSDNNPQFDGVFLDDVWGAATLGQFYREGTKEQAVLPLSVTKYWRDNMKLLLIQIKMAIGRKLLIINTGAYNSDYLAISDGQMYEAFCHAKWQPFEEYYSEWQKKLEGMIATSNSGKLYLAQSGVMPGTPDSQIIKTAKYCFAMFLLGANSNSYFYFSPTKRYQGVTYFPEWDVDLGAPVGNYRVKVGTPLFEREFFKGLVLINPSKESFQIDLGEKYKTLDGVITDTLTIGSREGEILIKHSED